MNSRYFFNQLYRLSRIIIVALPIIGFIYLVYLDFVPSGHLEFIYDFSKDSPAITNLFPANRMTAVNRLAGSSSYWQAIQEDPVYFEVRLPQKFSSATVEVTYQNKNQPLLQLGLRAQGEGDWSYQFKPLENQLLDGLDWSFINNNNVSLWQRQKQFLTIEQFLDQADRLENVGAYYYDWPRKFVMTNYQPANSEVTLNRSLRGAYAFYTYIKNEQLDFTFKFQDINRSEGLDPFAIKIYDAAGNKIFEQEYGDDGMISKYDPASAARFVEIKLPDLAEGVYKIQVDASDEIFTRQIKTKQRYLTFIDRLYLVDSPEYSDGFVDLKLGPTAIYSTIGRLGFATAHPEGLQSLNINDQTVDISETHKNYFVTAKLVPNYIYVPKNDLKIFGRGLLAFSLENFFNPEIYNLRDFSGDSGIDYLISSYRPPQSMGGWQKNTVTFDLEQANIENRKLRFAISAPELNSSDDVIPLARIKVVLEKSPLTTAELINKIVNYFQTKFSL